MSSDTLAEDLELVTKKLQEIMGGGDDRAKAALENLVAQYTTLYADQALLIRKVMLKVDDKFPEFELQNKDGAMVKSEDLLSRGAMVVVFYRGFWCPYCVAHLEHLQAVVGHIQAAGGQLVAISPMRQEDLKDTLLHDFLVLSDPGDSVAKQMGIDFAVTPALHDALDVYGVSLQDVYQTDEPSIPTPSAFVVDPNGRISWLYHDMDHTKRVSGSQLVQGLSEMGPSSAPAGISQIAHTKGA